MKVGVRRRVRPKWRCKHYSFVKEDMEGEGTGLKENDAKDTK